jgi:hypothetical protein
MRQTPNQKRSRGRSSGRKGGGHSVNRTFESNGPSAKLRGNASQLYEKYQALARDAGSAGDRISSENYMQHAEHYYRLMIAASASQQQQQQQRQQPAPGDPPGTGPQPNSNEDENSDKRNDERSDGIVVEARKNDEPVLELAAEAETGDDPEEAA